MGNINICLASDDMYTVHAGVVIASILFNANHDDNLNFYILDGNISDSNKNKLISLKSIKDCNINFVPIKESDFDNYKKIKTHNYITLATYYRLKLPTLLKNVDKVIYFDCDFVINSSLKPLFEMDMDNCPIAGVHDINKKKVRKNPSYVNAGMLIFDIKKMRELNTETEFLNYAIKNQDTITCGDQEIINEVCKGQIKILNSEWNVQSSNFTNRSCYTNTPKCIHFVSKRKPWHFGSFSYHRDYYFLYLQLTPWALNKLDKFKWQYINQIVSLIKYAGYRPFFLLRPMFWKAFYFTYIKST